MLHKGKSKVVDEGQEEVGRVKKTTCDMHNSSLMNEKNTHFRAACLTCTGVMFDEDRDLEGVLWKAMRRSLLSHAYVVR